MDRALKCYCLAACAVSFWLAALSPIENKIKVIAFGLALGSALQLTSESKKLIVEEARAVALDAMNRELEQTEIALHSYNQEQRLNQLYSTTPTYTPEVHEELQESLEHLYKEDSAEHPVETSASTSEKKGFYLAICRLLEVESETYVIEQVLKLGGRRWEEGKRRLQQILEEGRQNEW